MVVESILVAASAEFDIEHRRLLARDRVDRNPDFPPGRHVSGSSSQLSVAGIERLRVGAVDVRLCPPARQVSEVIRTEFAR